MNSCTAFIEIIKLQVNLQLNLTHLPPKSNLFFMKTIFIGSYKTIEEYYAVIFQKLSNLKMLIIFNESTSKNGICSLYTISNKMHKFHKNQTGSFAILTV